MGRNTNPPNERPQKSGKSTAGKDCCAEPPSSLNTPPLFTLCRESELSGRGSDPAVGPASDPHDASKSCVGTQDEMEGSTYGVQSLSDAFEYASTDSPAEYQHEQAHAPEDMPSSTPSTPGLPVGKKRKPGNPVHPKIVAAGQRIISSEQSPRSTDRPRQTRTVTAIPSLQDRLRSVSGGADRSHSAQASLILTPELPSQSTPRSGSLPSLRLSDEESVTFDDSASQAFFSSSGEEDDEPELRPEPRPDNATVAAGPQFVMPSLSLPSRRPFTERGSQMGNLRIMVSGRKESGKTALIHEMLENCPDIVHYQAPRSLQVSADGDVLCNPVMETAASTKAMPKWKVPISDDRSSSDTLVLERNISLLECDTLEEAPNTDLAKTIGLNVVSFIQGQFGCALSVNDMDTSRLLALLTGEGRDQVDVLLYLIKGKLAATEVDLITRLSILTNVIPVSRDSCEENRASVESQLTESFARCISLVGGDKPLKSLNRLLILPTANSAGELISDILSPTTMKKLRYSAAKKLIKWRKSITKEANRPGGLETSHLLSTTSTEQIPGAQLPSSMEASMTCSTISSPSGVLVPHADSSFYRVGSPALSAHTIDSTSRAPSGLELAILQHQDRTPTSEIREIRLAQWALDLQRSLQAEQGRQQRRWACPLPVQHEVDSSRGAVIRVDDAPGPRPAATKKSDTSAATRRCSALHGPDMTDPLGIVAFGQRLRNHSLPVALRLIGVGAALATLALACVRSWDSIRGYLPASWASDNPPAPAAAPSVAGFLDFGPGLPDARVVFGTPPGDMWDTVVGQLRTWVSAS